MQQQQKQLRLHTSDVSGDHVDVLIRHVDEARVGVDQALHAKQSITLSQ